MRKAAFFGEPLFVVFTEIFGIQFQILLKNSEFNSEFFIVETVSTIV